MFNKYIKVWNITYHTVKRDIHMDVVKKQLLLTEGSFPGKRGVIIATLYEDDSPSKSLLLGVYHRLINFLADPAPDSFVFDVSEAMRKVKDTLKAEEKEAAAARERQKEAAARERQKAAGEE